jgi:hypothetical protein
MSYFDVFNGDADGLCALHQLRLAQPRDATLVTGTKRDIALLAQVVASAGDAVTVLDLSMAVNHTALLALLEHGVTVQYIDHHDAGVIPTHPCLDAIIRTTAVDCTALMVDDLLQGAFRRWALVGAFGDNLASEAMRLGTELGLSDHQLSRLKRLGEALNYNAYGDSEEDLIVHPARLYQQVHRYTDPFDFLEAEPVFDTIETQCRHDLSQAQDVAPLALTETAHVVLLPDSNASRRVRGLLANRLVSDDTTRAQAVLTHDRYGGYTVSVRAPLSGPLSSKRAANFCAEFAHGGGRGLAAGINQLPRQALAKFIERFVDYYGH